MKNPVIDVLEQVQQAGSLHPVDGNDFDTLVICRKRGFITADDKGCYSITNEGLRILTEYQPVKPKPEPVTEKLSSSMAARMMAELLNLLELKMVWPAECRSLEAMQACASRGWVEHDSKGRYVLTKEGKSVLKTQGDAL